MEYDFQTLVDRSRMGSEKWDLMYRINPRTEKGIAPFSVADMELRNPPEIIEGLRRYLENAILGYTGPTPAYFDAVTHWMKKRRGWDAKTEWIVTSPGVVPAIFEAVRAFTEEGDGVIIMPPVYYPFYRAVEENRRRLAACPLRNGQGRYTVDFDLLRKLAAEPGTKLLILCSPHNPVGRVWTRGELEQIGRVCLDNGVLVVSDEIHFDLLMPGYAQTVFAALGEEFEQNCVVCTAPSKTFNLAGMQTSNIFIPNGKLREAFREEHQRTPVDLLNMLGYEACRIAYTECGEWLDQLLTHIDGNRRMLESFMREKFPEAVLSKLEGTYLQWIDMRPVEPEAKELERRMTQDARFFCDEGYLFGKEGEGFERVNLACPRHVLADALERMARAFGR